MEDTVERKASKDTGGKKEFSKVSSNVANPNLTATDESTTETSAKNEVNQKTTNEENTYSELDATKLKSDKVEEIIGLRSRIGNMIADIRHIQIACNKHEKESQYLKDYISNVMGSQDMR